MDPISNRPAMFSNRALVSLTIPIIIDALLTIMAGIVDSAMVSSAGEAAVSAVSLVDQINLTFITLFSGLGIGGTVITAQYIGSKNLPDARKSANQLLYLVVSVAAALMALLLCFVPQLLNLIYGRIEADVFAHAKAYFYWTLPGYPLFAVGLTCAALLRSMALNKQATILTASVNLLNVVGNAILIYGFHLGAAGAAISTTLSRMIFAVVGLFMLHNRKRPIFFENLLKLRIDFSMIKRLTGVGITNSLQNSLFQLGKLVIASLVTSFGTVAIAANSVANYILNIGWILSSAFGTVLLTVVGHCIGAGEVGQAKHYTKKLLIAASVVTYTIFTSVFLLREHLVLLFDFEQEALAASSYYVGVGALLTMASVYPLAFVPLSAFRAAGDLKYPLFLSVVSMFVFRVGLSYLLALVFHMGLMSVWLGFFADWVCHSVLNAIRLRNGKWIHARLI